MQQRRADAARRTEADGARRQLLLARTGARLRRQFRPAAFAAIAFALGIGAGAVLFQSDAQTDAASPGGQAAVLPGSPAANPAAEGALVLRMDADHAGFAARAASIGRKPR